MANYISGTMVRNNAVFRTLANEVSDPINVTFKMEIPSGVITTYEYGTDVELVRASTGVYYVDWTTATSGSYKYRFSGVGTVTGASEAQFTVPTSPFI